MITDLVDKVKRRNRFILNTMEWIAFTLVFLSSIITGLFIFKSLLNNLKNNEAITYVLLAELGLLIINCICFYIFYQLSAKNKKQLQYSLEELKFLSKEHNLMEIKNSYDEVARLRHDLKHYIQCIYTLLHNNKVEEAKHYINQLLLDKMSTSTSLVITNSEVVNAIISSKLHLCKNYGIDINYEITGSVERIKETDISILLANLLDNAIEGCMNVKVKADKKINLKIFNEKNYLVILINNTINKSVLKKNPYLKSTKKNKDFHGIGTLSIKDIVSTYNGMFKVFEEENVFHVNVWLNFGES